MKSFDPQQPRLPCALTLLIRLYPRAFRARFGAEMEATLAEQWQARTHQNRVNRSAYAVAIVFDAVFNAARQHIVAMTRPAPTPVLATAGGGNVPSSPEKSQWYWRTEGGFRLLPLTLALVALGGSAVLAWGEIAPLAPRLMDTYLGLFYIVFSVLGFLLVGSIAKNFMQMRYWRPANWKERLREVCGGVSACAIGAFLGWATPLRGRVFLHSFGPCPRTERTEGDRLSYSCFGSPWMWGREKRANDGWACLPPGWRPGRWAASLSGPVSSGIPAQPPKSCCR